MPPKATPGHARPLPAAAAPGGDPPLAELLSPGIPAGGGKLGGDQAHSQAKALGRGELLAGARVSFDEVDGTRVCAGGRAAEVTTLPPLSNKKRTDNTAGGVITTPPLTQ